MRIFFILESDQDWYSKGMKVLFLKKFRRIFMKKIFGLIVVTSSSLYLIKNHNDKIFEIIFKMKDIGSLMKKSFLAGYRQDEII